MKLTYKGNTIDTYSIYSLERDEIPKHEKNRLFIANSDENSYTGILLPDSNSGALEPWCYGHEVMAFSKQLEAFIAVNPNYMHPFTAAKKIATLTKFCLRRININFITGTAKSDAENFCL